MLPSTNGAWTIHGIWPTKNGTMGPFFCDRDWVFNRTAVEDLIPQMEQCWTNVEKGTPEDGLWKHEWEKHGTCAAVLPPLQTENKYFGQGLQWLQQYSMSTVLGAAHLYPDTSVHAIDLYEAVFRTLAKNPVIECYHDDHTHKQYLMEIRICFDKQLQLRDCDGALDERHELRHIRHALTGGTIITNCHIEQPVEYPAVVPRPNNGGPHRHPNTNWMSGDYGRPETTASFETDFQFPFVKLYRLIEFLRWFTF